MSSTSIYSSPLCTCIICKKECSSKGIHSHFLSMHGTDEEKAKLRKGSAKGLEVAKRNTANRTLESKKTAVANYDISPNFCKHCQSKISFEKRSNQFCSQSCATTFKNFSDGAKSEQCKEKISKSLIGRKAKNKREKLYGGPYTKLIGYLSCTCCSKMFWSSGRKTCSPECQRLNSTYRKIVHLFEHNGKILKLESTWEVDIAKWLNEKGIEWYRPNHIKWHDSTGKLRRYFPDFYLPKYDLYLDPKNKYQISISQEKLKTITASHKLFYGQVSYIKDEVSKLLHPN